MKVVFMGLGYIGLPSAALAASRGIQVVGVDTNPDVVESVN
jgi:UDP-N-acetyl-D-mannosaminuronic acid dehydrogenase